MAKFRIVESRYTPHIFIITLALCLLALALMASQVPARAQETLPPATVRFTHARHISAGISCLFCHPGAVNRSIAGLPSATKCAGCHQNIAISRPQAQADIDALLQFYQEGRPLEWKKVYDLPDFVRFPHQPHLASGINCERCHGNVGAMDEARPAYRINMGFCLDCHEQQAPEAQDRLRSCATCHY